MCSKWNELGRRVGFIESLYKQHKKQLKPGEGLHDVLQEAKALAVGQKMASSANTSVDMRRLHLRRAIATHIAIAQIIRKD